LITARMPRRIAVLAVVATAIASALHPSAASASEVSTMSQAATTSASTTASNAAATESQPATSAETGQPMTMAQVKIADNADRAANTAIDTITATQLSKNPLSAIPSDFSRVMGYTPTIGHLANGEAIAVNPRGGCSVIGGGRPFDLDVVCKAHDLGYDLLRYAHRQGRDLGPAARRMVDAKFGQDLAAQCNSSYHGAVAGVCNLVATTFDAGVGFNSWRQGFGAPVATAGLVRTVGLLALVLLGVYFGLRELTRVVVRRARRPRRAGLRPRFIKALLESAA
jgi:hypothetical protein